MIKRKSKIITELRVAIVLMAALCVFMTACSDSPDLSGDTDVEDAPAAAPKDEEPPTICFFDAHGEYHEAPLDTRIENHHYLAENFALDGEVLSYEDEIFTSRQGIDVSSHQGPIDWDAVAEDGIEFAIIRCGFRGYGKSGSLNIDSQFENNIQGAVEAGIDVGVYFFSQAINEEEAAEEAGLVLDILGGRPLALGICFDPESILDDDSRTDDVSGEQFTKNTIEFCRIIEEAGYDPFVYSNLMWEAFMFDMKALDGKRIWYADYEPFPQTPYRFDFWQYSESGTVQGISGEVDRNMQMIRK